LVPCGGYKSSGKMIEAMIEEEIEIVIRGLSVLFGHKISPIKHKTFN